MTSLGICAVFKANFEIGAGAEHLAMAGDNDGLDAVINREEAEGVMKLLGHDLSVCIVLAWAIEGQENDWRWSWRACWDMRDTDLLVWNGSIVRWGCGWKIRHDGWRDDVM